MKPSHLTTPRTMADCQFSTGYERIELVRRTAGRAELVMAVLAVVVGIAMLLGVL